MRSIHLVIADLFLPHQFATEIASGLSLPALEKLLGRGRSEVAEAMSLEQRLCGMFGLPCTAEAPIAPVSATFDGLPDGCWLRADPVHLRLQQDQLVLWPDVALSADEAAQLCASLNEHFDGQGLAFFAPHPQRWYLRLDGLPGIETVPLSVAAGRNVRGLLPRGAEAKRWHQVFNEIQMLLFAHPVNAAREACGKLPVNSVWLWGAGCSADAKPCKAYDRVISDDVLVEMFAAAADVPHIHWPEQWHIDGGGNAQLLVWTGLRQALQRGDLAAWHDALQHFETGYAKPLWRALRSGKITRLVLEVLTQENIWRTTLTPADAWAFWRRCKPLAEYSAS
ncbi:MAG TPA: hypothetical protein VFK88_08700 [Gallionella sp.]|nr:hypothetical protein [Gallionella sp.]